MNEAANALRTLSIQVELSESDAKDVCAFVNECSTYGLKLEEAWLSNAAGGERVSAESLSCVAMPAGDDSSSVKDRMGWSWKRVDVDLRKSRN
jgi:hypothetical protein